MSMLMITLSAFACTDRIACKLLLLRFVGNLEELTFSLALPPAE